ncbi:hypothetical protein FRC18_009018 [Serendipita sp. 400]|nr:hypothetical protein FRC18_009018 [Serendipita sp. 400]
MMHLSRRVSMSAPESPKRYISCLQDRLARTPFLSIAPFPQIRSPMAAGDFFSHSYEGLGCVSFAVVQQRGPHTHHASSVTIPPAREVHPQRWPQPLSNGPNMPNVSSMQLLTDYNQETGLLTCSRNSVQKVNHPQRVPIERFDHAHPALDHRSSHSTPHPQSCFDRFPLLSTDHRQTISSPSSLATTSQSYASFPSTSLLNPFNVPKSPSTNAPHGNQPAVHRRYAGPEPPPHLKQHLHGIIKTSWWDNNEPEPEGSLDPFISKIGVDLWCCLMLGCGKTFHRKDRGIDHVRMDINLRRFKCENKCGDDTCTLGFCSRRDLQAHIYKESETCEYCGDSLTKRNLRRHYESRRCKEARQNLRYSPNSPS